nr:hypothetical protein [Tanacetum cinerariifolium]
MDTSRRGTIPMEPTVDLSKAQGPSTPAEVMRMKRITYDSVVDGHVFVMNGGAIDWKSSKQSTTAMSSMEAEYIDAFEAAMEAIWIPKYLAAAEARMEAIWICKFIFRFGVIPNSDRSMDM